MSSIALTRHAARRARQRGIGGDLIDAFLSLADWETPVGSGCTALSISRRLKRDPDIRAAFGPLLDRIARLAMVMAPDGEVVTVMHARGETGRRYRRH